MRDRIPTQVLENGAIRYAVYDAQGNFLRYEFLLAADEPTDAGTPLNKANLLTDETAAALSLWQEDPTVNDALMGFGQKQMGNFFNSDLYLYMTGQHPALSSLPYNDYFYYKYLLMMHFYKPKLARSIGEEFKLTGNSQTISTVTTVYDGGNL